MIVMDMPGTEFDKISIDNVELLSIIESGLSYILTI